MQIAIIDGHDLTREALEKATVTTWDDFAKANGASLSSDEAVDMLADLRAGKFVKGGGGAEAEWTLILEDERAKRLTDQVPPISLDHALRVLLDVHVGNWDRTGDASDWHVKMGAKPRDTELWSQSEYVRAWDRVRIAVLHRSQRDREMVGQTVLDALKLAQRVMQQHRLAGTDQNPHGVMDIVGSAILEAERL